jgi:hypothetical protein
MLSAVTISIITISIAAAKAPLIGTIAVIF